VCPDTSMCEHGGMEVGRCGRVQVRMLTSRCGCVRVQKVEGVQDFIPTRRQRRRGRECMCPGADALPWRH
jgi:hypothetical protein